MLWQILGGIGLFLLGMMLMTDGLKSLAGGALRAILARLVRGPVSGVGWGAALTCLVQSSSATTMTTIGFVSAGLLSFPQAIGVIFGANLGTTSTGWIVSLLGFKFSIGLVAQPLIFVGVVLRLLGRDRVAALGTAIAGFGLLFVGLDVLQAGMAGLSESVSPQSFPAPTLLGSFALIGIGIAMTVVLQSSSAAIATTLAALYAGNITLDQAAAMVIGQNIGTCVTAVIASIGASPSGRRTAVAHIGFNIVTGLLALPLLPFIVDVTDWATQGIEGGADTIALAAFHTIFNVLGVVVLLPLVGPYSRLVERIIPVREPSLSENLEPSVASVPAVALAGAIGARVQSDRRIAPGLVTEARIAMERAADLIGLISTQPTVRADWSSQNNLLHAVDHLVSLIDASEEAPSSALLKADEGTLAITKRLQIALESIDDPGHLETLSREVAQERAIERKAILERTSTGDLAPSTAMRRIDAVQWADSVLFHLWRSGRHLADSGAPRPGEAQETSD